MKTTKNEIDGRHEVTLTLADGGMQRETLQAIADAVAEGRESYWLRVKTISFPEDNGPVKMVLEIEADSREMAICDAGHIFGLHIEVLVAE